MRPIVITASIDVGAPPEDVWRFVSDTDRTNRVIGAAPVTYMPIDDRGPRSARYVATTSAGAFDLTYEEQPFEYSYARELRVVRKMRGGFLESYALTWSLAPSAGTPRGTKATIKLELLPRYAILAPLVWLNGRSAVSKLRTFASSVDDHVRGQAPSPFAGPTEVPQVNEELLGQGVAAVARSGVSADLAWRLGAHLREAPDADLVRIRPFELADALKEDRRSVLVAMLHGVPAGLFDLRWAIICPSCRTASEIAASLEEVKAEGHCHLCDISFELDLDRSVEVTFVPHEAVRRVEDRLFCISGPSRTPHVWAQTNIEPDKERALSAPRDVGRYRVFARGGASGSVEIEEGAPAEVKLTVGEAGVRPAEAHVAPGGTLLVLNATPVGRHVKIERLGYASDAATAHYLSTLDDFRRLFSRDLLKRGTPLKVARVSVLFSDLTGSTALYTKVGDAAAFRLVDDHFDVMKAAIKNHGGILVKTMGDAVMAGFREPNECVRAATEALRAFEEFRRGREHGELVGLKLGAVAGACYIVTANSALDYFGQTVNVASRVQHLAASGEIVIPHEMLAALPERDRSLLDLRERFEARVKGVDEPLDLVRLALRPS
jgi:class 3 adenylate cyclase